MLNWIVWNRTTFLTSKLNCLKWNCFLTWKLCIYANLNCLEHNCFWHWNCVLMLNWIVWNRTIYKYENGFSINNLQWLLSHQMQPNQRKRKRKKKRKKEKEKNTNKQKQTRKKQLNKKFKYKCTMNAIT